MKIAERDKLVHDFKSPLAIIKGQVSLLREKAEEGKDVALKEISKEINEAVDRLNNLINNNL